MKIKQLTVAAVMAIIGFTGTELKAQGKQTAVKQSAIVNTTQVSVTLADIIGATPGTAGTGKDINEATANGAVTTKVDFVYNTTADYAADQKVERQRSITAMSSKSYNLSVKALSDNLIKGADKIPVSVLRLAIKRSSDAAYGTKLITPTTANQVLFSGEAATSATSYDVQYSIPKEEIAKYISNQSGVYNVTIYYTLETV